MSWNPASSDLDFFPDAISITKSKSLEERESKVSPSTKVPQLKSIQLFFLFASVELVAIFTVGTGLANGVPRPVVNKTMCAPEAARAVEATKSFQGALKRFKPCVQTLSP